MINIALIIIFLFIKYFNRAPINNSNLTSNYIVSPCYGTVSYANKNKISVFLSPLDVHVQYVPIDSIISDIKIVNKNNFELAYLPSSNHNEGVRVVFSSIYGDIVVIQRVGFFVRRIINEINIGDSVKRSIYGIITFGSRVDIELPGFLETNLKKVINLWWNYANYLKNLIIYKIINNIIIF